MKSSRSQVAVVSGLMLARSQATSQAATPAALTLDVGRGVKWEGVPIPPGPFVAS
jgi:hypothetical protein